MVTVGSLFSGVGLLDLGLHLAGFEHVWLCEIDEWRRSVLRKRFPGAVVYDDVRTLRGPFAADASDDRRTQRAQLNGQPQADREARALGRHAKRHSVEACARSVDLIAGGFPCKGASTAGKREGFGHAETVLWCEMRRVIGEVRPRYVLIENVAAILGMAAAPGEPVGSLWGTVLGDLAALGASDIRWDCVPAAAVGAPHLRDRVFAVATYAREVGRGEQTQQPRGRLNGAGRRQDAEAITHDAADAVDWGDYRPAIERWEAIHGAAPEPLVRWLDDGDAKLRRVRARVDRSRLSALGDGVCVHVAYLVGEYVMGLERERLAAAMDDHP